MGNCAWMFSTIVAGAKLASVSRISVSLVPISRESICDCKRTAGMKCVPVFSLAIKRVARSCAVAFRCTKTMGEHDESPACTVVVKLLYIPFFNLWEVNWEPALRRTSRYLGHNAEHANTTQVPFRSWSTSKSLSLVNHGMRSSSVRGTPLLIFSGSSNKALCQAVQKEFSCFAIKPQIWGNTSTAKWYTLQANLEIFTTTTYLWDCRENSTRTCQR